MDFATLYGLITVSALLGFVGIVAWVFSTSTRERFHQAGLIPFQERDIPDDRRSSWVRHY